MRIPLFDLDWTILKGGNTVHANAFAFVFRTVYGIDASVREIETDGMIDSQIITEVLLRHGRALETIQEKMTDATAAMGTYFDYHEAEGVYEPLPGVTRVLTRLQHGGVPIGLLTGNIEVIAWRKLQNAGLHHFIGFGAFGNEKSQRSELIPLAQQRSGRFLLTDEFVIVGDSPRDMLCAREGGVQSLGVASGKYSVEQLLAAGANTAVASLEDIAEVTRALGLK